MESRIIRLFGAPRIERMGKAVRVGRRKSLALLAYVTLQLQPTSRDALAALLWPDNDHAQALAYLRTSLWTLSQALGADWLTADQELIEFNRQAGIEVDVLTFQHLIRAGDTLSLAEAVELVTADFLTGFQVPDADGFEEWQLYQIEALRQQYIGVLDRLIQQTQASGDTDSMMGYGQRWLKSDPLSEPAHRALMWGYASLNQRSAALRQFQQLETLLDRELGVAPEYETIRLHQQIAAGWSPTTAATTPVKTELQTSPPERDIVLPLPQVNTAFVGRERELSDVLALLCDRQCRLLTVLGPGGIGKTRFALQVAERLQSLNDPQPVFFLQLASLRSVDAMASLIVETLQIPVMLTHNAWTAVENYLANKRLVLVLDNFEHLLDGASAISHLLATAPGVQCLVTSRERLQLQEEWIYELRGLEHPFANKVLEHLTPQEIMQYSAVSLFLQRCRLARPSLDIDNLAPEALETIVTICELVEGMPLCLELAASWMSIMSFTQIEREIRRSIDFLASEMRNVPERHRSMRAVFEQSWMGLSTHEQQALSSLAVFRGEFTMEAADAVANANPRLLRSLVWKSLVQTSPMTEDHYRLHELLRQFADEKLTDADRHAALARHAHYFVNLLNDYLPGLISRQQFDVIATLRPLMDDVAQALQTLIDFRDWPALRRIIHPVLHIGRAHRTSMNPLSRVVRPGITVLEASEPTPENHKTLGMLLGLYCSLSFRRENYFALQRLTDRSVHLLLETPHDPEVMPVLICVAGFLERKGEQWAVLEAMLIPLAEAAKQQGDHYTEAMVWLLRGWLSQSHARYPSAEEYFQKALPMFEQIGQPLGLIMIYEALEQHYRTIGNASVAQSYLEKILFYAEATQDKSWVAYLRLRYNEYELEQIDQQEFARIIRELRDDGDRQSLAWTLYQMAWLRLASEEYSDVEPILLEALQIFREIDDREGKAWLEIYYGVYALGIGDTTSARQHVANARKIMAGVEFPWIESGADFVSGDITVAEGDVEQAWMLYLKALRTAFDVSSALQTLRHLLGVLELIAREDSAERHEMAYERLAFVHQHPISSMDVRLRAEKTIRLLEAKLTPEQINRSHQRADEMSMTEAVEPFRLLWTAKTDEITATTQTP
jgi:DNA-binding SARP family transcriptional activator/predicted ATPase